MAQILHSKFYMQIMAWHWCWQTATSLRNQNIQFNFISFTVRDVRRALQRNSMDIAFVWWGQKQPSDTKLNIKWPLRSQTEFSWIDHFIAIYQWRSLQWKKEFHFPRKAQTNCNCCRIECLYLICLTFTRNRMQPENWLFQSKRNRSNDRIQLPGPQKSVWHFVITANKI